MSSGNLMLALGVLVLGLGYLWMTRRFTAREITAVASLGALSAAGRVAFAPVPSVQPSTIIVILSGWVLGPGAGFVVGATTAVVSNVFLGQGPWTIWQMLSWALIGTGAGFLGRVGFARPVRWLLVYSAACGLAFGWVMNVWMWLTFVYPHTLTTLLATMATSVAFDVMHAGGNVVFGLLFARRGLALLERFRRRTRVTYLPEVACE